MKGELVKIRIILRIIILFFDKGNDYKNDNCEMIIVMTTVKGTIRKNNG